MIRLKRPARGYQEVLDPNRLRRVLLYRAAIAFIVMLVLVSGVVMFDRTASERGTAAELGDPASMPGGAVTGMLGVEGDLPPPAGPASEAATSLLPPLPASTSEDETMAGSLPGSGWAPPDDPADNTVPVDASPPDSSAMMPDVITQAEGSTEAVDTAGAGDDGSEPPGGSAPVAELPAPAPASAPAPAPSVVLPTNPSRQAGASVAPAAGAERSRAPTASVPDRSAAAVDPPSPRSGPTGPTDPAVERYQVVVGHFIEQQAAIALQAELASAGHPALTQSRVTIGPFPALAEAERALDRLRAKHALRGILVDAASGSGHAVQVGVFSEAGNAIRLINRLEAVGFTTRHDRRVLLGPYSERQAADQAAAIVRQGRSLETSVIRLR